MSTRLGRALSGRLPRRLERRIAIALDSGGEGRRDERDRFFRDAARWSPLVAFADDYGTIMLSTGDVGVSRRLFLNEGYADVEQLLLAMRLLEAHGRSPAPGSVFVDVGAHVGSTTLLALARHGFGAAVALEPAPDNHRLLRANVALNGLGDRVQALRAAASDHEGTVAFSLSPNLHGTHRVAAGEEPAEREVVEVEAVTLDALCERGVLDPERCGFLWIDAEGHEPEVLAGAARLLERPVPVLSEFRPALLAEAGRLGEVEALVAERFELVFDITGSPYSFNSAGTLPEALPAARISELSERHAETRETDLLLA